MPFELANARLRRELPAQRPIIGRFALHVSERKLLLMLFDVLLLNLMFCLSRAGADASSMLALLAQQPLWFAVLSLVWLPIAWTFGCYRLDNAAQPLPALTGVFCTIAATWAAYLFIPFVTPMLPGSRLEFLRFPLLACSAVGLWRLVYATVLVQPDFRLRALIVGAGESGATLARLMAQTQRRGNHTLAHAVGYEVLGFVDDDPEKQNQSIEGTPILGRSDELAAIAEQLHPHEIVIAITHGETMNGELFEAIQRCREMGIALTTMQALYERLTGRVPIEHTGRTFHVAVPLTPKPFYQLYGLAQRLCDIVAGMVGCCLLLAVIPFVWLINAWKSPGPLFYTQERIGKGGRRFNIIKFRSMRVDAEKFGAVWAEENDPRITAVGNFLRKTRLDEVPQFWNVLRGDMSLIGPRPERPHFVTQLAREIPFYRARHAVKPGITGWAQVKYRYGASVEDSLIKLEYDLFYIKHQNLLLDLEIALQTLGVVLGFRGR